MIRFVAFSIKRAWQGFWRNAVMSLAATATMILMLLLLAGFWIIQSGLTAGLQFVEQKVEVVADLRDNITATQIEQIRSDMLTHPEVESVSYVSKDEALASFRSTLQAQGEQDLTQYLDANPLHPSVNVKLKDPKVFGTVLDDLRAENGVTNVKDIHSLVDNLLTVTNVLRTAGVVILGVIGLIVLFIIVNTIRLAVFARAEEIEVMRLVGASDAFIRWPFVFEGAFVGLLGAAVTLGVLAVVADPLGRFMFDFFRVLPLHFGTLARDLTALVLGAGVGLGVLGSWVSVRTYLIR
ncbi:MAG TPA: permease-like cell division protein FtsX [Candidatus Limnocylindrales bacterium]|nr:permease-like cell division protein FtsX [Candidatus Limnocylindrales bacterium]